MLQISEVLTKEIADQLDSGMKCFYHLKTGELISYPDELRGYGDIDEEVWGEDMRKVEENFDDYFAFTAMESYESFRVIEDFVEQIPETDTRQRFEEVIQRRNPFQQFKDLLFDYPDLRQQWFVYKDQCYREYVKHQIDAYNERDNGGDDTAQSLRFENEILKLKMQAERGAFFGGNMSDLPPETEAQFLKDVERFESNFENAKEVSVYEHIGSPSYKKAEELNSTEVEMEMNRLLEQMQAKNINLDVLGEYEPAVIYKFITGELFNEKIREMNIPGYTQNFIYEEFHPNHKMDIGNAAQRFLNDWLEKGFNEYSSELADQMVTAEGKIFSREEVRQKLNNCLDSYRRFLNIKFAGSDISFEWDEKENKGLGHAEGMFRYDAEIENGEIIHIEGPYKLYMINEYGLWQIFYFIFPGFSW